MNEKIVKTIRSRPFVAVALLNRGVCAVMRTWMGPVDGVFEPTSSQAIEVFILSCRQVVRRSAESDHFM
jgi:hypothetical protein